MQTTIDYRRVTQPSFEEIQDLKARAYKFTTIAALARVFKCKPQQVSQAFVGGQPSLINKIKNYVEKYEARIKQEKVAA